jgi:hypothetical protein
MHDLISYPNACVYWVPAFALVDAQISLRRIDSLAVFKLPAGVCCVIVSKALRFD